MIKREKNSSASFLSGVLVLSVSTIIVKIIGLAYKIPMLSFLGAEGMGYFNSAYEIYALLCVISTAGLPTALSMLISSYKEQGALRSIKKVYSNAVTLFLILGLVGTTLLIAFASWIAEAIENENSVYCIIAIAPALLCVCISSAVRGYFQGHSNMLPTALSQFIEAAGKLLFGVLFAYLALKRGYKLPFVAAFAVAGLSFGTLISALYLIFLKLIDKKKSSQCEREDPVIKNTSMITLLRIALPITLSSAVISITRLIDMSLIMKRLQDIGYTSGSANEMYGAYSTVAVPIFSLLPSLLTPISLSLIPALSAAIERRSADAQGYVVESSLRLTTIFAIPSSFAIILYSAPIISLLFSGAAEELEYVYPLLSILGASVPFSSLITTTNAILQAYRKTNKPIISMAIGAVVKIVLAYILIGTPSLNVYGAPISTFFCDVVITIINIKSIRKITDNMGSVIKIYIKPLLASGVAMLASLAVYMPLYMKAQQMRFAFIVAAPIAILVYFILAFFMKIITPEDIDMLPMGDKINRLFNRKRFHKDA